MPVSLERLIAEIEPAVITEEITRDCIQVSGSDAEAIEEKKRTMLFREVERLVFSFKTLAKISNLDGLHNLTKLQLDNNRISKIENISHLTNLTWLDLSFNKITKIEGLEALSKLVDLSLFNNQLAVIENLDTLKSLNVLSLGNNALKALDNVMYLRQFKDLRMINLAGNPICSGSDYRSYVLSHLKGLIYLDYSRVQGSDVAAALEQHQDEMNELQEREEQRDQEEREAEERHVHTMLMRDANLDGVESCLEDMVSEDPEWARLQQVPGLVDCWNDTRDKFNLATDEFKVLILEQHMKKKGEHQEWLAVVNQLLRASEGSARGLIAVFEKGMKHVKLELQANPGDTDMLLLAPKAKLVHLKDQLLQIEMDVVEKMQLLNQEFDRNYSEIVDINKGYYNTYFSQVRDLQNNFFSTVTAVAAAMYDKYSVESSGIDSLPEAARLLLQDKEGLVNALQASHDSHTGRIDALEDRLVNQELKTANDLAMANMQSEYRRNRDRVSEIINYIELSMMELDDLAGDEDGDGM